MRLALFSPLPPVRSGIATCSADLVAALGPHHEIDCFVDEPLARAAGVPPRLSAHEFVWRHRRQPYDLTIYQLGNSSHHDYQWPYLFRYPGLTVLHDAHLHHARAAALLRTRRAGDYRAEFVANHPDRPADLAELAVAGFDSYLYYQAPMRALVVGASKMVAVHTPALAAELRAQHPGAAVEHVRLGHGIRVEPGRAADVRPRVRADHRIPDDAVVFGAFGALTPEKRIPQILEAFAALLPYAPSAHLLLAGAAAAHFDVHEHIARRQLGPHVTVTGYVEDDEELTDLITATDVSLNLRWPTAREVSGPWLRSLAAGIPTITMELAHTWDLPSLDPRAWRPRPGETRAPVTVAIDIVDEDHSLRLAMRRLASDAALRASLAAAGRACWESHHSIERMVEDYERLLPLAAASAVPRPALPPHLVNDGEGLLRGLAGTLGVGERMWSRL